MRNETGMIPRGENFDGDDNGEHRHRYRRRRRQFVITRCSSIIKIHMLMTIKVKLFIAS